MPFRLAATLTAIVCAVLFVIFLLAPQSYSAGYGVPGDAAGEFLGRRASPLLLGLAVMLWSGRNAPASPLRSAVCYGVGVCFAGIAFTGLYEYGRNVASITIVVAAGLEMVVAAVFLLAARRPD